MSNSKLVSYTKLSPNCTHPRRHAIDTITIHCMAGPLSVEGCGVGVWGLVMGQTAANLAYNNWKWPLFVMKENGLSYKEVYQTGVRCIQRELMGVWRK